MKRFIFNQEYFEESNEKKKGFKDNDTFKGYTLDQIEKEKQIVLCNEINISRSAFINKLNENRNKRFNEDDYNQLNELDPLLMLDVDKLVKKLIVKIQTDIKKDNVKFLIYAMLIKYAADDKKDRKEWQTLEEIKENAPQKIKIDDNKLETILKEETIVIDTKGNRGNIFKKKEGKGENSVNEYSFELTNLIKYTNL